MILDALREDFVEFDKDTVKHRRLDPERDGAFLGKKLTIFKELKE